MESIGELRVRELIMRSLADVAAENGGSVTREQLSALNVEGRPRRIIDQSRGIWNPRDLSATLSVVSSPSGPYDDHAVDDLIRYDYRAGSLQGDNTKLRLAYELELPIIFLRKIEPGVYVPIAPVYVIGDDRQARQFLLSPDEGSRLIADPFHLKPQEQRYAERIMKQRLHQPVFRGQVLRAYETRCAVCSLKHARLLDAAHIIADSDPEGSPVVRNGLSLCKIHHAAYDVNLLGVSPDYVVHIDRELLEETDGPMLKHGLQEMDHRRLRLPTSKRDHPDRERLARRFEVFSAA